MGGCVSLYTPTKNAYNAVMLLESEIAEEKTVTGMKVETPDGWKAIKKVYKTIPLDVWCVVTSRKTLKCSGHHLLKTPGGCVEVCELSAGDIVETIDGFEVILCVYDTGEQEELYDITVDSEDGLFYSNGFISHNSTTFCTRQLLLTHLIPAYKSLYVVPHHKQLETYGARFGQMEMAFRIKSTVQNVYNKTYRNRSTVNMIHCGETSQAARGKSADECVSVTDRVTVLKDGKETTIPLKDIKPGMMVKSFYQDEEGCGSFRYNKVEAYKDKGVQECFEIKTSDGIVTCTANHKLCAVVDNTSTPYKTDWVYAKDLEASGITQLIGYKGVTDILAITPVGEKHVADIQVARDRNFIAGGVIAHNCVIDECVTSHTRLNTGLDKTISICDIPIGAKVTGFNANNERTTVEITAKKCNGYRRCYRIRTESGKELVCTGNHRLRTDRGWMYTIVLAGSSFGFSSSCESEGTSPETRRHDTCLSPYDLFLLRSGDVYNGMEAQADSTLVDWENSMFEQGVSAAASTLQEEAPRILIETERGVEWDSVKSIEYAGVHEVWDITTTPHHTFFADGIGVHNCQSLDPEHVEDILYTLTDSQMPTKVFAGTALSIDTLLEAKWQESSMGMWHVRAMDGKNWLNMYDKDVLYKVCSNPQGPTCPYTGKLLKVTDGCFVHAYEDRYRDGRIGLHIPQCIIPDLAYNPIKWGAIYDKVKNTDFKKVLQECFGIAIAEGSREITSQDLQRMCVIPDTPEQLKQKCKEGFYRVVISGCDWGGSDYNPSTKTKTSYTVHCIIGLAPDNHIDILHYKRYSGMMYNEIAAHIIEDHNAYHGTALASDFGVGLAYNMELRKYIPVDRHFIIGYVGPKAAAVSVPKDAHLDNQLSVNRTEALTNVFRDAKCIAPQKICCRNWTEMKPFLEDWLNMFRVPTEDNTGRSTFKYIRAATKADDALHAFTFAYVLMKIFMGESLIHDPQLEQKIQAIMTAPNARMAEINFHREIFGDPVWCISG